MDYKRVTVIRIGPVVSTKEALYFVGSMVLFFLLKLVFWGLHCFACTVFRLLQAVELRPRDSARWSNLLFYGTAACKKS